MARRSMGIGHEGELGEVAEDGDRKVAAERPWITYLCCHSQT